MNEERKNLEKRYTELIALEKDYDEQEREEKNACEIRWCEKDDVAYQALDAATKALLEKRNQSNKKRKGFGSWFLGFICFAAIFVALKQFVLPPLPIEDKLYYIAGGVVAILLPIIFNGMVNAKVKKATAALEKDEKVSAYLAQKRLHYSEYVQESKEIEEKWKNKWNAYFKEFYTVKGDLISLMYANTLVVYCKHFMGCKHTIFREGHILGGGAKTNTYLFKLNPGVHDISVRIENSEKYKVFSFQVDTEDGPAFICVDDNAYSNETNRVSPEEFEKISKQALLS